MESGLLALEAGERGAELIDSIFRAAHSIKGGAATFGFSAMAELTHVLETLLDQVRSGERGIDAAAIDALLASVDVLRDLLEEAQHERPADHAQARATRERLQALLGDEAASAMQPGRKPEGRGEVLGWRIRFQPEPGLFMSGNDPLRILRELGELGPLQVQADLDALPDFDALDPLESALAWSLELQAPVGQAAIDEVFAW